MTAREIARPARLCDARGRLDDRALGFSRTPLVRANLSGARFRKKRWDYWAVCDDAIVFALTIADVDYVGLAAASVVDLRARTITERAAVRPFGRGVALPDTVRGSSIEVRGRRFAARVIEEGDATRLVALHRDLSADIVVARPRDHESLNVVVPWSASRFALTSKHVALPARGTVAVRGRSFELKGAFACLDFGRGVWPYRTRWNWAAGAGRCGGRTVGLNFGARWTDGTGASENGVVVDGRLHKIDDPVVFRYDARDFGRPWRLESPRVALSFTPTFTRAIRAPLGVASAALHWAFGRFDGEVMLDGGDRLAVRDVLGWAEELRARW